MPIVTKISEEAPIPLTLTIRTPTNTSITAKTSAPDFYIQELHANVNLNLSKDCKAAIDVLEGDIAATLYGNSQFGVRKYIPVSEPKLELYGDTQAEILCENSDNNLLSDLDVSTYANAIVSLNNVAVASATLKLFGKSKMNLEAETQLIHNLKTSTYAQSDLHVNQKVSRSESDAFGSSTTLFTKEVKNLKKSQYDSGRIDQQ
ncbi:MAG: hypothetical protein V4544_01860 [Pseudomonadota bacterium]